MQKKKEKKKRITFHRTARFELEGLKLKNHISICCLYYSFFFCKYPMPTDSTINVISLNGDNAC